MKVNNFSKVLMILSVIMVLLIPAIHKLASSFPPEWFLNKFNESWIDLFPLSLTLAFGVIVFLELISPAILFLGLLKQEVGRQNYRFIGIGFRLTQVLFLILIFGSFMVQDYDNGFKDFVYLGVVSLMEYLITNTNEK